MTVLERFDDEPEIRFARRAYATAQGLLGSEQLGFVASAVDCSWHNIAVHRERGYFALVDPDADPVLADLVGDVLQVTFMRRSVFVYCVASVAVPAPLSLALSAWVKLAPPRVESVSVVVRRVT